MNFKKVARVVLELALDRPLDYGVKDEDLDQIALGMLVEVPLRAKAARGIVLSLHATSEFANLQPITKIIASIPILSPELIKLAGWMVRYYGTSLSRVLRLMIPSGVKKHVQLKTQMWVKRSAQRQEVVALCRELREKEPAQAQVLDVLLAHPKGLFLSQLLEESKTSKSPIDTLQKKGIISVIPVRNDYEGIEGHEYFYTKPKALTNQQQAAFDDIAASLGKFQPHLLYGITGSGKTEVYLQLIDKVLERGESAIILVPEIALTTQMIERFRSRLQVPVGVLHSQLSDGERAVVWQQASKAEISILIGARSSLFAPMKNLGLIIVDEEHEASYKQTYEMPCYHARDVAVMRAHFQNIPIVLGSATPSLESYYNAKRDKYRLNCLSERPSTATLPCVEIIDMKREFEKVKGFTLFSEALLNGIAESRKKGEQVILFLNRRGYHTSVICAGCGAVRRCPHCDIKLTRHFKENILTCHMCHYTLNPPPETCEECKSTQSWIYKGAGTEQVQRALHAIFPGVRTLRLDADTTRHKGSHEQLLREFRTGKAEVMIGTQMVTKGLHFPSVTLVGVLNCDATLNIPDFRSSEQVFQLVTQVAGRAGRGALPGRVILQTMVPENTTLKLSAIQDYPAFFESEIAARQMFFFPPFIHVIKLLFWAEDEEEARIYIERAHQILKGLLKEKAHLHDPGAAIPAKIKDRYFFQMIIRATHVVSVQEAIAAMSKELKIPKRISWLIDTDPLGMS